MTAAVRTPPRARPAAVWVAMVWSLLLIALGVVAVRDLAVSQGWAAGTPWSRSAVEALDGLEATRPVVTAAAVVVGLLGLYLVWLAVRPARRTHHRADTAADVWFAWAALVAMARETADRTPGVASVTASSDGRRRVVLDIRTGDEVTAVRQAVQDGLRARIAGLTTTAITVRAKGVSR